MITPKRIGIALACYLLILSGAVWVHKRSEVTKITKPITQTMTRAIERGDYQAVLRVNVPEKYEQHRGIAAMRRAAEDSVSQRAERALRERAVSRAAWHADSMIHWYEQARVGVPNSVGPPPVDANAASLGLAEAYVRRHRALRDPYASCVGEVVNVLAKEPAEAHTVHSVASSVCQPVNAYPRNEAASAAYLRLAHAEVEAVGAFLTSLLPQLPAFVAACGQTPLEELKGCGFRGTPMSFWEERAAIAFDRAVTRLGDMPEVIGDVPGNFAEQAVFARSFSHYMHSTRQLSDLIIGNEEARRFIAAVEAQGRVNRRAAEERIRNMTPQERRADRLAACAILGVDASRCR